jgi:hypothetical protein
MAAIPSPTPSSVLPLWSKQPNAPNPPEFINSVAISGDGNVVVAGTFCHLYAPIPNPPPCSESAQFGTYIWDGQGNALKGDLFNGWQGVYWVGASRDGSTVASGGWYSGPTSPQGFVAAYDVASKTRTLMATSLPGRTNMVALSENGVYLVVANESLYLYMQKSPSSWGPPQILPPPTPGDYYVAATISADGSWIAACTAKHVVMLIANSFGFMGKPIATTMPNASIYSVAMAANGSFFAAAGTAYSGDAPPPELDERDSTLPGTGYVYVFSTDQSSPQAAKPLQLLWSAPLPNCKNCRNVALRDDGAFLSAVGALTTPTTQYLGGVSVFKNVGGNGTVMWSGNTIRDPNGTSMDASGDYVTVADGYQDATPTKPSPGYFYLFDAYGGSLLWSYKTDNMAWPCVISAKGNAIVGGSDDGNVYSFSVAQSARAAYP